MKADPVVRRRSVFADKLLEFPDLVFSDGAEFQRRGAWHEFFRSRIGPRFGERIIFEIGCADAALLSRVAQKFPETAFVGIDWKCRTLCVAAEKLQAAGLRNVALLQGRAQDIGRVFDDGELHEIWLFHPDPCDKPQELRNRLVAEPFLLDAHRVLRDEGVFVLKTDHSGYYRWVLALLGQEQPEPSTAQKAAGDPVSPLRRRPKDRASAGDVLPPGRDVIERFEVLVNSANFWNDEVARCHSANRYFAGEATGFETRFMKKNLPIYYVELKSVRPTFFFPPVSGRDTVMGR